jgi:diguanylate cyclase (GGDEF)-like protein
MGAEGTPPTPALRLAAELERLRASFLERFPERHRALREEWRVLAGGEWSADGARALHRSVHGLVGTAGSMGLSSTAAAARRLERRLLGLLEHQRAPGSGDRAAVEELLALLTAAVAEDALRDFGPPEGFEPHLVLPHFEPRNLIVVVETAEPFARELQLRLSHFGFELQMFERVDELRPNSVVRRPAAVILDLSSAAGAQGAPAAAAAVRAACGEDVPVVFVSSRADIEARLEAVRAGCNGYFVKPVNFSEVVTTLDRLTRSEPEPYRILIVDDEAEAAAYHAASLEAAGLQTAIVTDPLQVTSQLVEFRPDVILMDVYMPRCSGAELAAVIRQEEAFVGVPIVFLSRETDRMKQIAALGEGGDDFFSKPVPPAELVAAVAARALRGRTLRQLMERDGLTGLYTHSRIIEQLEAAVRRADRRDGRLAVAMIDVDGFKGINDSHGHLAGDQVLKALAQLLRQRLRLSDILGRFGGDEYLVVLPDTDGAAALAKMDDIRCNFGAVEHDTGRQSFSVTLSAGIAEFPLAVTGHELIARADEALYRAKRAGRNRVVLAREEG